jgi:predicted ferric reductase
VGHGRPGSSKEMDLDMPYFSGPLFATLALVTLYGSLCLLKEHEHCERLTSEIMCTGYAITGVVFMIGLNSYFRHRIPYEIFYSVHHLLFILYIVTVAHTLIIYNGTTPAHGVKLSTGSQQLFCTISAIGQLHTSIITRKQSSHRGGI